VGGMAKNGCPWNKIGRRFVTLGWFPKNSGLWLLKKEGPPRGVSIEHNINGSGNANKLLGSPRLEYRRKGELRLRISLGKWGGDLGAQDGSAGTIMHQNIGIFWQGGLKVERGAETEKHPVLGMRCTETGGAPCHGNEGNWGAPHRAFREAKKQGPLQAIARGEVREATEFGVGCPDGTTGGPAIPLHDLLDGVTKNSNDFDRGAHSLRTNKFGEPGQAECQRGRFETRVVAPGARNADRQHGL